MSREVFKQRFQKEHLLKLFLVCAFPFHLWTILLVLKDVEWITRRSDFWDAIGVGAYALIYAFLESFVFFMFIVILGILLPWKWERNKVFAQLGFISMWIQFWAILFQFYRHRNLVSPLFFSDWLISTGHPLVYGIVVIGLLIIIVIGSAIVPIYLIGYKHQVEKKIVSFLERVTILSILYIALDIISAVILLIRNA